MPDAGQATPDELAAFYLRGRDAPCPGCGYNRRDATAAACPECGLTIPIGVQAIGTVQTPARHFRRLIRLLIAIACVGGLSHTLSIAIFLIGVGGGLGALSLTYFAFFTVYVIGSVATVYLGVRALRHLVARDPRSSKTVCLTFVVFALTPLPGYCWGLYNVIKSAAQAFF